MKIELLLKKNYFLSKFDQLDQIKVRELGAQAFAYTVDCSSSVAVTETAERVLQELGRVYMLINNAGVLVGEDILNLSDQNIKQTFNINVMAHFWVSTIANQIL